MSKGIVVTTSEATKDWLPACLQSLQDAPYDVYVHRNGEGVENGFELAGIAAGKDLFDEFVHLMDTCEVKDISLIEKLFGIPGHVFLTNGGYHYLGKFVSSDLPDIPRINSKTDAIQQELRWLRSKPKTYFTPDLPVHTDVFIEKNGRRNMVLSNPYIIKYKATFSL